jgi:type IV pilus assembly protein PilA
MKKLAKGFTLIELMIVVAIIGILAAIAIPNFVKYQLRSKFSEASSNIEGLRKAEEALRQGERGVVDPATNTLVATYAPGQYWNMNLATAIYPITNGATPGTAKIVWTAAELAQAGAIDWQVEGATYFQYEVSVAGCNSASTPAATDAGVCYSVGARSDIDGDGVLGEAALVKPSLDGTITPALPAGLALVTAWPGTLGNCVTPAGLQVLAMPCTLTGPDVF